jgi:hypothetical protein
MDFFECRLCHVQFCRSENPGFRIIYLDDSHERDLIVVYVRPDKGDGNFPIDRSLKKLEETLRERIRLNRPKRIKKNRQR